MLCTPCMHDVFGKLSKYDFGEVHFKLDKATHLQAIVAIHDSRLGPALGGCRFIEYDTDDAAIVDALRLARGMTYKAALAGLTGGHGHGHGHGIMSRGMPLRGVPQLPARSCCAPVSCAAESAEAPRPSPRCARVR